MRKRARKLGRGATGAVSGTVCGTAVVEAEDLGRKRDLSRKSWGRGGGRLGEEDLGLSSERGTVGATLNKHRLKTPRWAESSAAILRVEPTTPPQ